MDNIICRPPDGKHLGPPILHNSTAHMLHSLALAEVNPVSQANNLFKRSASTIVRKIQLPWDTHSFQSSYSACKPVAAKCIAGNRPFHPW